jgi:hypothetical protein
MQNIDYKKKYLKYKQKYLNLYNTGGALVNRQTNLNDELDDTGKLSTKQLTNMPISCFSENKNIHGINQLSLRRQDGDPKKIFYDYNCVQNANIRYNSVEQKATGVNDYGAGRTFFLDRHNIDCDGRPIIDLELVKRDNTINYNYKCANEPLKPTDLAVQLQTPVNNAGGGLNIYLDRHLIQCPAEQILSNIKLNSYYPPHQIKQINYNYRCGSLPSKIYSVPNHLPRTQSWLYMALIYCNFADVIILYPDTFETLFNQCIQKYNTDPGDFGAPLATIFGPLEFANFIEFKQRITQRLIDLNIPTRQTIVTRIVPPFLEDSIFHIPGDQQTTILYKNDTYSAFLDLLCAELIKNPTIIGKSFYMYEN